MNITLPTELRHVAENATMRVHPDLLRKAAEKIEKLEADCAAMAGAIQQCCDKTWTTGWLKGNHPAVRAAKRHKDTSPLQERDHA